MLVSRRPSGVAVRAKKPAPPALLSGYLKKVKSQKKNFLSKTNRRFFIADARTERLLYYKKRGAKLPQGGVPLDDVEEVRTGRRDDEFEVIGCSRQFILRAESAKECAAWIEALREHVAYARAFGRHARSVSPADSTSADDSERPASSASTSSASSAASSVTPRVRAMSSAASSPEDSHGRWSSSVGGGSERSSPEVEELARKLTPPRANARVSRIVQPRVAAIPRGPSLQNGRIDDERSSPAQRRPAPSPVAMQMSSRSTLRRTHSVSSKECDSPAGPTVERFVCTAVSPPSALALGRSGRRAGGKRHAVTPAKSELVLSDTESECESPLNRSFSSVERTQNGRSVTRDDERIASKWDEEEEEENEALDEVECATGRPTRFMDGAAAHAARTPTLLTPAATRRASSTARAAAGKKATTPNAAGTPGVYRGWDSSEESSVCVSSPAVRAPSGASSKDGGSGGSANEGHPYVSAHRTSARSPATEPSTGGSPVAFHSWDSDDM